jgi:hypothetical protein
MPRINDRNFSVGLAALFILFLAIAASNQDLCFDTCYNLISWQNLATGKGFVYDYAGQRVPFDPVISTGPELYLPTFLLWSVIGNTDYWISIYVLVGFYAAFSIFLIFVVMRATRYRFYALVVFAILFFCRKPLFTDNAVFITPLGEPLCVLFVFSGTYLLVVKRLRVLPFLLIGLGLDLKTNIIIGILPMLAAVFFFEQVMPAITATRRDFGKLTRSMLLFVLGGGILLAPNLLYVKVIPKLVLAGGDEAVLSEASNSRRRLMFERGFGHFLEAIRADSGGLDLYTERLKNKIGVLKGFYGGNRWITAGYFLLLLIAAGIARRKRHFSFYLLLFSGFIYAWWLLAASDPWYRYWATGDVMVIIALTTLSPELFENRKTLGVTAVAILAMAVFIPQFSFGDIRRHFENTSQEHYRAMVTQLREIDEKRIYTWGWFQAPHLMILTGKRFQDLTNPSQMKAAIADPDPVYFLFTIENTIIQPEMDRLMPYLVPVASYGYNRLYLIKKDEGLLSLLQPNPVSIQYQDLEKGAAYQIGALHEGGLSLHGFAEKEQNGAKAWRWATEKHGKMVFRDLELKSKTPIEIEFVVAPFKTNENKKLSLQSKLSAASIILAPGLQRYKVQLDFPAGVAPEIDLFYETAESPKN